MSAMRYRQVRPELSRGSASRGRADCGSTGTAHLPDDQKLVDVCDRGADTFEFLEHEAHSGRRFAIRARQDCLMWGGHNADERGRRKKLISFLRVQKSLGSYTVKLPGGHDRRSRKATLKVAAAAVLLRAPRVGTSTTAGRRPHRMVPAD